MSVHLERWIARKLRLRHVELISEVFDCRSILKASKRLNVTQPAVTKAVKDIESTLNLQLFERTSRGLNPTLYGEIFARHAKTVLAQLRHAAEELENLRVGYSGHVNVGTLLAASAELLPESIALLKKERPGVALTVVDGTYDVLLPALMAGDLDMVLGRITDTNYSSALVYEELYVEPICLVTRKDHPLTRRRSLELKDLVHESWILPVRETTLRRQVESAFLNAKVPMPNNVVESMSILTNKMLLRKSDCIGIMPYHVAHDDVQRGLLSMLPIRLRSLESPVGVIRRAPGDLPPAASALLERLRAVGGMINKEPGKGATSPRRLSNIEVASALSPGGKRFRRRQAGPDGRRRSPSSNSETGAPLTQEGLSSKRRGGPSAHFSAAKSPSGSANGQAAVTG